MENMHIAFEIGEILKEPSQLSGMRKLRMKHRSMIPVFLSILLIGFLTISSVHADISIDQNNFPDDRFRRFILDEKLDQNQDGVLSDTELSRVTGIFCNEKAIASLKGIEFLRR